MNGTSVPHASLLLFVGMMLISPKPTILSLDSGSMKEREGREGFLRVYFQPQLLSYPTYVLKPGETRREQREGGDHPSLRSAEACVKPISSRIWLQLFFFF
ncbi:hypothetical protein CHARACLAT_023849 [Characodon lateralis]|uniref:Secreted protein n=1 Tax=Characodon lateralis TaxID=208331 RepID=A0ABU7ELZ5_9TELE|nr:hypothetical protein [Characodon lateralis]